GLEELYVADLDAIAGRDGHREAVRALAREARVWLDAGTGDPRAVAAARELGVARVVVGTETLAGVAAWRRLPASAAPLLSLDLRRRRVLSRAPELAGLGAAD